MSNLINVGKSNSICCDEPCAKKMHKEEEPIIEMTSVRCKLKGSDLEIVIDRSDMVNDDKSCWSWTDLERNNAVYEIILKEILKHV